jgi:hypothetical protein
MIDSGWVLRFMGSSISSKEIVDGNVEDLANFIYTPITKRMQYLACVCLHKPVAV